MVRYSNGDHGITAADGGCGTGGSRRRKTRGGCGTIGPDGADGLYAAFKAKDARFDGRFFVGVASTGIYCRPVCRAKQPKPENCSFFSSAAEAERAGYRPCLLCRPERAPGTPVSIADADLAYTAARMLEDNCAQSLDIDEVARKIGCSTRHLRRVFEARYSVPPIHYLQTCRLLLAKSLLTDTELSVLDIAMASGFGSLRRFNTLFKSRYRLTPTALRKQRPDEQRQTGGLTLTLGYRPPYPWDKMLRFLADRAISGVEVVSGVTATGSNICGERAVRGGGEGSNGGGDGGCGGAGGGGASGSGGTNDTGGGGTGKSGTGGEYARTVCLHTGAGDSVCGWLKVRHHPKQDLLCVTVSESLFSAIPEVLARVKSLFDLRCDPDIIFETLDTMNQIRPGLCVAGTRLPGCFNSFEMAVRAVLGQQVTVRAAGTLGKRIAEAYGRPIQTGLDGLTHLFPSPKDLLELDGRIEDRLGALGITPSRVRSIAELARAIEGQEVRLGLCVRPEDEIEKLKAISGIGSWTAQYIAMRAMEWPDAFLETDAGVKKALKPHSPKEILAMSQAWRPWRSYATVNLWQSL
jgi:AraC family transcriptional regulator of adaptative response / DNA-3-methyladenine glycosylase II